MLASIPDEVVAELLKAAPSSPPRRRAVHSRLHPFGSPLPFMGEGLGERAENAAKLPVSPSPQVGEGTDRVRPLLM
ncbi:hypothetical protein FIV02_05680 [Pseudomonas sp. THAF187a]|nr:hypothetical protein FIV02_05680 [Pseudomonas sp. THAF187a]QFT41255.1 hypothetical protein FIU98_05670 [Pseudomonas sp. THAF42]